jgi:phosphatidylglycerophosphate synthase
MIPQRMYIVSMEGEDIRFLGGSARARNARVGERAGGSAGSCADLAAYGDTPVVLVPTRSALMLTLFTSAAFVDAVRLADPLWLDAGSGASVLVGPAHRIAAAATNPDALAAFPHRSIPRDAVLNIATAGDRRRATTVVLRSTRKSTDGWISRELNRPISRACSRVALALGVGPTLASGFTLLVGLACAWAASRPGYLPIVITGVLFQIASVLDGVDGEIARATLTESSAGARMDTLVDQVTYVACFAGVSIGWGREGHGALVIWSTVIVGAALVATLLRGGSFVARHGGNASFVLIDRAVRRAAVDTNRVALRVAAAAFTLLRRDLFALIFLGVSLTGLRAAVPALILAGTVVANATFSLYGRELADAARAECGQAPLLSC